MTDHSLSGPNVNLHELVNLPGAGNADAILTQRGHHKEVKDGAGTYHVTVTYSVTYEQTVTVQADTVKQARRLAREDVSRVPDWGDELDLVIEDCRVEAAP